MANHQSELYDLATTSTTAPMALQAEKTRPRPTKPTRDLPALPPEEMKTPANLITPSQITDESLEVEEQEEKRLLTPLQAHYLKKTLISMQFRAELSALSDPPPTAPNISTLSYLGSPFQPPPKGSPIIDLPFTKFMFRRFVLTFPFLAAAPKDFFPSKFQPFIVSMLTRNIAFTDDPLGVSEEQSKAHAQEKFLQKLEKQMAFILTSATKLVEKEDVVRLSQADLQRLEILAKKRQARAQRSKNIFEVNIICVRAVADKGRVRSRVHDEFVIRTRRSHQPDILVSRRYGDFKTLADTLRKAHPQELVKPPPVKDRTHVTVPMSAPSTMGSFSGTSPPNANDSAESLSTPLSPRSTVAGARLAREKNRLTLRSYLHSLMSSAVLVSSPVLRSFLTANPTKLNVEEEEDAKRREEADRVREEGRQKFADEMASRVEKLREALKHVKESLYEKDGLTSIFSVIRSHETVADLPPEYRAVMEWGRTSLASTLFQHFVASDSSSENLAGLKRIHGLIPYMLLKGVLKISNPLAMIRGALDLFLAQPFGGRSLLQRLFTSSLTEEVKALQEDIGAVQEKVDDPIICEKLRLFIYAPVEIQDVYRRDAVDEHSNILTCILRSPEEPALDRVQIHRVLKAHRAHAEYLRHKRTLDDSDDDDGPQDEDGWLYEDLGVLAKLYARLRDREQLIALIFEGTTADLLKDMLTIFYSPLAQVYKAASISDSIGDLQSFINDLLRTAEQVEESSQSDASGTVKAFLDLVKRHEQAFYHFVHKVHTKGESLFVSLVQWTELFLTFIRDGIGEPVNLEFLLPHHTEERQKILQELDAITLYHYKLKVAYEEKVRRRFGKGDQDQLEADEELAAELVNGAVQDASLGQLVRGDVDDLSSDESEDSSMTSDSYDDETEESESGSENETVSDEEVAKRSTRMVSPSSEYGSSKGASGRLRPSKSMTLPPLRRTVHDSRPPPLPSKRTSSNADAPQSRIIQNQRSHTLNVPNKLQPESSPSLVPQTAKHKNRKHGAGPQYPELHVIPGLLPLFVELIRPHLRNR